MPDSNTQTADETSLLPFAEPLIAPVLNGSKTATVRKGHSYDFEPGDRVTAAPSMGTPFVTLEIKRTADAIAIEAYRLIEVFGADYSATCPQDVIDTLNEHYDETIRPSTQVQVIVFEVVTE
jgi:hypothetical protein